MSARRPFADKLSRERILDVALMIADEEGIDALNMRRIAAALDTGAMSLYNHVPDKKALLEGLVDRVLGTVELPVGASARQLCQSWAQSLRAAILAHRSVVPLMVSSRKDSPLRSVGKALVAALTEAGVDPEEAVAITQVLGRYVAGSVVLDARQGTRPESSRDELDAVFNLGITALLDGLTALR